MVLEVITEVFFFIILNGIEFESTICWISLYIVFLETLSDCANSAAVTYRFSLRKIVRII